MSKAKSQGTAVESAAVSWLVQNGFPEAERRTLNGSNDLGDLRLRRNPVIIAECKRAMGVGGVKLTPWMREAATEVDNAGALFGILIAKQRGAGETRVGRWFAAMDLDAFSTHLAGRGRGGAGFPWTVDVSPTKVNSEYVGILAPGRRRVAEVVPFGVTYTPGSRSSLFILGPLEQFVGLMRAAGFTEGERQ